MATTGRRRWRASVALHARAREMRHSLTPAEQKLWSHLRAGRLADVVFRRQHPVDRFIVDFFCPAAQLVIEIDGDSHATRADYDAERTRWLNSQRGYRVMRFTNDDIAHRIEAVLEAIAAALRRPHL